MQYSYICAYVSKYHGMRDSWPPGNMQPSSIPLFSGIFSRCFHKHFLSIKMFLLDDFRLRLSSSIAIDIVLHQLYTCMYARPNCKLRLPRLCLIWHDSLARPLIRSNLNSNYDANNWSMTLSSLFLKENTERLLSGKVLYCACCCCNSQFLSLALCGQYWRQFCWWSLRSSGT